jgi:hypothetical protein
MLSYNAALSCFNRSVMDYIQFIENNNFNFAARLQGELVTETCL